MQHYHNEYRQLSSVAARAGLPLRIFRGLYREEITGRSDEREELYKYQKEYARQRMLDAETRLLNGNALYRDYSWRLNGSRTFDELRAVSNEIRRENYNRERGAHTHGRGDEPTRREETTARPLTEREMRLLFSSPAPEHYTDEMRGFRYGKVISRAERERREKDLERGDVQPSPALEELLAEFGRTAAHDRSQHLRNINLFIADLIYPPRAGRNRFTPVDLHAVHARLSAPERNHLFRVINGTKEALKNDLPERKRERFNEILREKEQGRAAPQTPLRLPADSASFRRYTGAVAWREAELLTEAAARMDNARTDYGRDKENRQAIVESISNQNLETVVTLLRHYKPDQVAFAAEYLGAVEDREMQRVGEVLTAFKDMRRTMDRQGQVQYQITTAEGSSIPQRDWQRVLDHLHPQIGDERVDARISLPTPLRREMRRAALGEGWTAINPTTSPALRTLLDEPEISKAAAAAQREIDRAATLQQRLSVAHNAEEQARLYNNRGLNRSREFRAYTRQIKAEFLASFQQIDEASRTLDDARSSFVRARDEQRARERVQLFADVRPAMEQRISEYLNTVLRDHGETAFERGRGQAHHATMVSLIIKEGIEERGIALSNLNLTDEHVERVAQEIVGNLPRDLRDARERNALTKAYAGEHAGFNHRLEQGHDIRPPHAHNIQDSASVHSDDWIRRTAHASQVERGFQSQGDALSFDEEFVEQKVNRSIGQIHEQALPLLSASTKFELRAHQHKTTAHELNANHHEHVPHHHLHTR